MYSLDPQRMILCKYFSNQILYFGLAVLMGLLCSQKQLCVKGLSATAGFAYRGWGRKPDRFPQQNPSKKKYLEYKGLFYSQYRFICAFYIEDKILQRAFFLISHYNVA